MVDSSFVVCIRKLNGLQKEGDALRVNSLLRKYQRLTSEGIMEGVLFCNIDRIGKVRVKAIIEF